jgi:hypothetical protein
MFKKSRASANKMPFSTILLSRVRGGATEATWTWVMEEKLSLSNLISSMSVQVLPSTSVRFFSPTLTWKIARILGQLKVRLVRVRLVQEAPVSPTTPREYCRRYTLKALKVKKRHLKMQRTMQALQRHVPFLLLVNKFELQATYHADPKACYLALLPPTGANAVSAKVSQASLLGL